MVLNSNCTTHSRLGTAWVCRGMSCKRNYNVFLFPQVISHLLFSRPLEIYIIGIWKKIYVIMRNVNSIIQRVSLQCWSMIFVTAWLSHFYEFVRLLVGQIFSTLLTNQKPSQLTFSGGFCSVWPSAERVSSSCGLFDITTCRTWSACDYSTQSKTAVHSDRMASLVFWC